MNLHPELVTALTAQREREFHRRAEHYRMLPRRKRMIRKARWIRRRAGRVRLGAARSASS